MNRGLNHSGRLVKKISFPPRSVMMLLISPLAENSTEMRLTMMTVERK